MSAKKAALGKKKPRAKSVKASKTTKSKSGFTSVQSRAYQAAFRAAIRNANRQARANSLAQHRVQSARTRAAARNRYVARRQIKIVRNTYLQSKYGAQVYSAIGVPLRSRLATQSAVSAYLQVRYGKKTYAITKGGGRVRVKPKVKKGKIVAAGKNSLRQSKTNRTAYAAAYAKNVARRVSPKQKPVRKRGAAGHHENFAHTQWITAGNDQDAENCVAVAIANSLLYSLGYRVTDEQVAMIKYDRLNKAMWMLGKYPRWWPIELLWYKRVDGYDDGCWFPEPGDIVGFETEQGSHCGVLMPDNMVVSWGEIVPLESPVDEAWRLTWRITG